jgi:hypothetical protein
MLRLIPIILAIACGGGAAKPTTPALPATAKRLILVDADGVGLGGHDPIAYATDNAAVKGAPEQVSEHGGAKYRFASADHKATFDADKAKHAPQYGGYCAYAASQNRLSESDPTVFEIVDGQLLVFTNADFKQRFDQDVAGNKAKADANWPGLVATYGK